MDTIGQHLLVEYVECNFNILNDTDVIESLLLKAAKVANTKVIKSFIRPFVPQGVTGVVVIEESHMSIHTWPEKGYASVDFYTCGDGNPYLAHDVIHEGLEAKGCAFLSVNRGNLGADRIIKVECYKDLSNFLQMLNY